MISALSLRSDRTVIVTDRMNFPTDVYIAQGVADLLSHRGIEVRYASAGQVASALDDNVAAVSFSHVDYRSARIEAMEDVNRLAHASGALTIWDLSHSVGAVPVDLNGTGADFAVGCGYKYLNGGPGAPAFFFAAERYHARLRQPISGWLGHAAPFEFSDTFSPASSVRRLLSGTPPVISMSALDEAVKLFAEAPMADIRAKSVRLTSLMIELVESVCPKGELTLQSPRDSKKRGSHVMFGHEDGYAVVQALKERDVIGDFRAPDGVRLGVAPLYTRFVDVWDAVQQLNAVLRNREWDRADLRVRRAVT